MVDVEPNTFIEIGERLRAHRMGRGLSPEALASRLNISRAALYRAERGEISKIDMLLAISRELGASLATLLGAGTEYLDNAVSFFERMRQLEHDANQIIGLFSPVSYLLTSPNYDQMLEQALRESATVSGDLSEILASIDPLLAILKQRKARFELRKPLIASIISSADLERFLRDGLGGRHDLSPDIVQDRRRETLREVRHIVGMLREQPIGVQIVIAREPIPATSFQIMRQNGHSTLTISPFRLGQDPNIQLGVGQITTAPEALELHEQIAHRLWEGSLKGEEAARHLDGLIDRFGIK